MFESVDGAPAMKDKLDGRSRPIATTFAQWVAITENIAPLVSLISHDTASVLPQADNIIAAARDGRRHGRGGACRVAGTHAAIHHLDRDLRWSCSGLAELAHRPLDHPSARGLGRRMKRLADRRHLGASFRPRNPHDEIGAMARTVVVFRDNMIERERLADAQDETNAAREQRGETIAAMIRRFSRARWSRRSTGCAQPRAAWKTPRAG